MPPTKSAEWAEDRLRRIIDVSATKKLFPDITEYNIRDAYQKFGPISNIYSWRSNSQKNHFYVEFQYQDLCEMARREPIPGFNSVGILNDVQHRKRLISLSSQTTMPFNHRYSPYEPRGASTSRASLPMAADQGGNGSPQHGHQTHQQPFLSSFPYDEWPKSLDNGLHTVLSTLDKRFGLTSPSSVQHPLGEINDTPMFEEGFKFPADDVATSSALLRSTSDQSMGLSVETPTLTRDTQVFSTQNTPGSRTSEQSVEELLEALSNVRDSKREESDQDASPSIVSTRLPRQFQIHPRFDFRRHIKSGRFLNTGYRSTSKGDSANDKEFQLTPLQAYFADIYASLQTELHHTKRQHRQDALLLEHQQNLITQYKQEAADERTARMAAESAVGTLQDKCHQAEKLAIGHQMRAAEAEASLETLKREFNGLKAALAQISNVCAEVTPLAVAKSGP